MKVRSGVKPICRDCVVSKREGRVIVTSKNTQNTNKGRGKKYGKNCRD